jgi:hypothetical protein
MKALSSLTASTSKSKVKKNSSPGLASTISKSRSRSDGRKGSQKRGRAMTAGLGKDEFLSQDLISRLFINHQKQQEVNDQKKYI